MPPVQRQAHLDAGRLQAEFRGGVEAVAGAGEGVDVPAGYLETGRESEVGVDGWWLGSW